MTEDISELDLCILLEMKIVEGEIDRIKSIREHSHNATKPLRDKWFDYRRYNRYAETDSQFLCSRFQWPEEAAKKLAEMDAQIENLSNTIFELRNIWWRLIDKLSFKYFK